MLNLKQYSILFEQYIYYFGNERLKGEYKALLRCSRSNYRKTKKIAEQLIKEGLLPSVKEMRFALENYTDS